MFFLQFFQNPLGIVIFLVMLVITVTVHEWAHAKAADELGDPTAEMEGRLTLDPRAHLDPLGSLMFLIAGFGWGKPVPFDPYNLRNPHRDSALIAFAGPFSNAVMASVAAVILFFAKKYTGSTPALFAQALLPLFISLNIRLGIFNLLPFAPLDGFKVVGGLLPKEQSREWYSLERYGIYFLLFFILPFTGGKSMLELFIVPVIDFLQKILV
ncbi:MAG: site-2 protease family protein [Candidatus Roizmanbacteria bacterium]